MSARSSVRQTIFTAATLFAALFVVTVLLAAIPAHRAPTLVYVPPQKPERRAQQQASQQSSQATDHAGMPGMDMSAMDMSNDAKASEHAAVEQMTPGTGHDAHSLHMYMTRMRSRESGDIQRANEIVSQLRAGIDKYKDYNVALNDGYHIFLPKLQQPEYHFTSYKNGFLEAFAFDPARPTSLLYKKTSGGYQLVGAMYTMPKRATEEQLNARVPLSVAMWHLHTNLCMPQRGQVRSADWTKFGLKGTIATQEGCDAAGGRFSPAIFGWMVHVYPYEDSLDKIFAMHHRD